MLRRHREDLLPIDDEALRQHERGADMGGVFEADDGLLLDRQRVGRVVEVLGEARAQHLAAALVGTVRLGGSRLPDGLGAVGPGLRFLQPAAQPRKHAFAVLFVVALDVEPEIGLRVHECGTRTGEDCRTQERLRGASCLASSSPNCSTMPTGNGVPSAIDISRQRSKPTPRIAVVWALGNFLWISWRASASTLAQPRLGHGRRRLPAPEEGDEGGVGRGIDQAALDAAPHVVGGAAAAVGGQVVGRARFQLPFQTGRRIRAWRVSYGLLPPCPVPDGIADDFSVFCARTGLRATTRGSPAPRAIEQQDLAACAPHRQRPAGLAARVEDRRLLAPARLRQRAEAVVHVGGPRSCTRPASRASSGRRCENVSVSNRGIADAGMHEVHHAVERRDRHRAGGLVGARQRLPLADRVGPAGEVRHGKGARRPGVDRGVVLRPAVLVRRDRDRR